MDNRIDGWSIVIVGNWNLSIFAPNWVSRNLFANGELQVEFPLTPGMSPRYKFSGIAVWLEGERLIVRPGSPEDEHLERAEKAAVDILNLLPHTPVRAVGVNFSFEETTPDDSVLAMFRFPDGDRISDLGYSVQLPRVVRQLTPAQGRPVNLSLQLSDKGSVVFDFNYHSKVKDTEEAMQRIRDSIVGMKNDSKQLLKAVYGDIVKEVAL